MGERGAARWLCAPAHHSHALATPACTCRVEVRRVRLPCHPPTAAHPRCACCTFRWPRRSCPPAFPPTAAPRLPTHCRLQPPTLRTDSARPSCACTSAVKDCRLEGSSWPAAAPERHMQLVPFWVQQCKAFICQALRSTLPIHSAPALQLPAAATAARTLPSDTPALARHPAPLTDFPPLQTPATPCRPHPQRHHPPQAPPPPHHTHTDKFP